jgi:hypothetical protein
MIISTAYHFTSAGINSVQAHLWPQRVVAYAEERFLVAPLLGMTVEGWLFGMTAHAPSALLLR